MDSSGNNRYELLFMDDDVSDPLDNIVVKNKKQVKTAAGAATAAGGGGGAPSAKSSNKQNADGTARAQPNKKPNQAEKENKPSAMNKNDGTKKTTTDKFNSKQGGAAGGAAGGATGAATNVNRKRNGPPANGGGEGGQGGQGGQGGPQQPQGPRPANFRQQNGETREQRNNRRNVRENGFNNNAGAQGEGGPSQQQPRQFRDRDNRGPPRNRNFEGGNRKREFDRQSGSDKTGVKAVDKRDGAGAHNWGSVKEAIDDVNKNETESGNTVDKADESGNEQAEQAAVEEETKELTLDEWKAQKQQRVKPTFNIRKAGEGEDTSQWKKMIVLNNNKKKENESEEELEFDPAMYPQRVGRQQRVLDIQFNFNDGRRGGGGFGGRGRGRGPRPGGGPGGPPSNNANIGERPTGPRGGGAGAGVGVGGYEGGRGGMVGRGKRNFGNDRQQQNAAPKVNDERQFPTLA